MPPRRVRPSGSHQALVPRSRCKCGDARRGRTREWLTRLTSVHFDHFRGREYLSSMTTRASLPTVPSVLLYRSEETLRGNDAGRRSGHRSRWRGRVHEIEARPVPPTGRPNDFTVAICRIEGSRGCVHCLATLVEKYRRPLPVRTRPNCRPGKCAAVTSAPEPSSSRHNASRVLAARAGSTSDIA